MKPGTKVRLVKMSDPYPIPPGTVGVIEDCDALGDYLVNWSYGSTLKLIPEIDEWEVLDETDDMLSSVPASPHSRSGGD